MLEKGNVTRKVILSGFHVHVVNVMFHEIHVTPFLFYFAIFSLWKQLSCFLCPHLLDNICVFILASFKLHV